MQRAIAFAGGATARGVSPPAAKEPSDDDPHQRDADERNRYILPIHLQQQGDMIDLSLIHIFQINLTLPSLICIFVFRIAQPPPNEERFR